MFSEGVVKKELFKKWFKLNFTEVQTGLYVQIRELSIKYKTTLRSLKHFARTVQLF